MTEQQTWVLPFGERPELDFHSDWGVVSLVPVAAGEEPRVEVSESISDRIEVRVLTDGGVVRVEIEPRGTFAWLGSWGGWDARVTVHVPPTVIARLETSAGSISARDLEGCALAIRTSAGKIELDRIRGALRLAADAGSITARDVSGRFDVQTEAGSIRLDIVGLEAGEHTFRASMGSIRVDLAPGIDVNVQSRTSLGSVRNSYPSRDGASVVLNLATELGSIRVQPGQFAARPSGVPNAVPRAPSGTGTEDARDGDAELERILRMVESGKLSAREADDLLRAMGRV